MLRKDHPDILLAQHELALAYMKDGQTKKATNLLEIVVTNTFGTWATVTKLRLHIP
jgi:Tfp pilus assembly protein PilF